MKENGDFDIHWGCSCEMKREKETRDKHFLELLYFLYDSSLLSGLQSLSHVIKNAQGASTAMCKKNHAVFPFLKLCSLFFFLSVKRENMWPLAPEVNFFISAVPSVWNTFIRDVRSLQSHWSCMVFDHHALPWSPKCFTSVYIHKKIGDKRGRRGIEKLSGEWDSHSGWWADVNLDETQSAIWCTYMKIIHATKQTHFWV